MTDGSDRLHGLDAVRAFALVLGIFFHASASFMPSGKLTMMWMIMDAERSPALGLVFYVLHIFRMTTFFVIAGFFARMLFHRRGLVGFAKDRGKRIALPLVAGWPFVMGAIVAAVVGGTLIQYGGPPPFDPPPEPPKPPLAFPLTHLWFLYVLLVLYALGLAGRAVFVAIDPSGGLRSAVDRVVAILVRWAVAPLLLAVPAAIALNGYSGWMPWVGIPTPDNSLIPNPPAFAEFGVAFAFGWLLQRQTGLLSAIEKLWPLYLAAAVTLTGLGLWQVGIAPTNATDLPGLNRPLYAATYTLAAWTWTFAFIGMALRFLSGFSAWRRYLADASYWLYIVHLPLVIFLQGAVAKHPWPAELKYLLILAIAFPLMLGSYHLMVRYTWLGAILNGRRQPRPGKARIPATSPSEQGPA
jgi:glucan biosynthesis protein C